MAKMKEMTAEELATFMHDTYEEEARNAGWKTQESCRVPFADLPQENKTVMLKVAASVLEHLKE